MRLSLIFFGLSSVFAIVSSVPLGSIGLEKRQIGGTDIAAAAAPAVATAAVGDITSSSPVAAIFGDIVSSYSSAVAGTGAAAAAAPAAPAAAV
ncbi:hypothetical protein G6F46_005369 [Rhizopus delemar]|uniref:Uncharacterized protein n=3 Tax=Rhizopus TaxID=4842 RepID=I1CQV7_RHIO9|nr:hypothetical protein RO3G_15548 [Rhizopus delemar RA 99-880]KAG1141179.1 hypothetical protein G6F36_015735 [Rhizopus arrhizus]KAG1458362.1 hypothetical protein G6F55_005389 [Rhizopus delemar]KAG1496937.1 hypothetical protein G6F54_006122 [Rhizopus delemar]KAG1515696.1 hypothetical protein G6F53_002720 [Rhizopus delemar]|eukprot:EIE90837.1 hypothetical protein RO3G_15548 [Rhizopus delemar RA 99-880]